MWRRVHLERFCPVHDIRRSSAGVSSHFIVHRRRFHISVTIARVSAGCARTHFRPGWPALFLWRTRALCPNKKTDEGLPSVCEPLSLLRSQLPFQGSQGRLRTGIYSAAFLRNPLASPERRAKAVCGRESVQLLSCAILLPPLKGEGDHRRWWWGYASLLLFIRAAPASAIASIAPHSARRLPSPVWGRSATASGADSPATPAPSLTNTSPRRSFFAS